MARVGQVICDLRHKTVFREGKSVSIKVYLTAWYYPVAPVSQYRPDDVLTGSRGARHSSGIAVYLTAKPNILSALSRP
jgi:hypothetical protein